MFQRSYHYLIAGLPDLLMGDRKMPVSVLEFRDLLREALDECDYSLIRILFLPYDHINLLNTAFKKNEPFNSFGNCNQSEIEQLLNKNDSDANPTLFLPSYLISIANQLRDGDREITLDQCQRELTSAYYLYLSTHPNELVAKFGQMELTIRNVLAAANGRKYNYPFEPYLFGDDETVDALKKNRSRDFGLSSDVEYIDTLVNLFDLPDILEREQKIDALRWHLLDDLTFFNYFSVEKIVGYMIKLIIVERWSLLDVEKGREFFRQLLKDIESGYKIPEEFNLTHGKKQ